MACVFVVSGAIIRQFAQTDLILRLGSPLARNSRDLRAIPASVAAPRAAANLIFRHFGGFFRHWHDGMMTTEAMDTMEHNDANLVAETRP
jgi:hypothetical protein